jgi:hypothetical protein
MNTVLRWSNSVVDWLYIKFIIGPHVYYFLFELDTRTVVYGTEIWNSGDHAAYCSSLSLWNRDLERWWPCHVLQLFKFTFKTAALQCGVESSNIAFISYNTTDVYTFLCHSHYYGARHICTHMITLVWGGRTKHMHCRWMVWCSKVHKRSMATEVLDGWASWWTQGTGL